MNKDIKKIACWFFGHDPLFKAIEFEYDKKLAVYTCKCGKTVKFDETRTRLPYMVIRGKFERARGTA